MERPVQTRENHARIDPMFHYFILPVLAAVAFFSTWQLGYTILLIARLHRDAAKSHEGYVVSIVFPLLAFLLAWTLLLLALRMRMYAVKVQDRVIRLEERLRMATLLPENLRTRIPELSERQLIALRFASDSELSALVARTLNEKLSARQIKDGITHWRGDYWRV